MIKPVFKNIQSEIQLMLFRAQRSIKISVAWFTNDLLFQPLLLKLATGVSCEIILNDDSINRDPDKSLDFDRFVEAGGILHWVKGKLMHQKFCIIDDQTVISGSYNWTTKAEYNHEEVTIFDDSLEIAAEYLKIFNSLAKKYPAVSLQKPLNTTIPNTPANPVHNTTVNTIIPTVATVPPPSVKNNEAEEAIFLEKEFKEFLKQYRERIADYFAIVAALNEDKSTGLDDFIQILKSYPQKFIKWKNEVIDEIYRLADDWVEYNLRYDTKIFLPWRYDIENYITGKEYPVQYISGVGSGIRDFSHRAGNFLFHHYVYTLGHVPFDKPVRIIGYDWIDEKLINVRIGYSYCRKIDIKAPNPNLEPVFICLSLDNMYKYYLPLSHICSQWELRKPKVHFIQIQKPECEHYKFGNEVLVKYFNYNKALNKYIFNNENRKWVYFKNDFITLKSLFTGLKAYTPLSQKTVETHKPSTSASNINSSKREEKCEIEKPIIHNEIYIDPSSVVEENLCQWDLKDDVLYIKQGSFSNLFEELIGDKEITNDLLKDIIDACKMNIIISKQLLFKRYSLSISNEEGITLTKLSQDEYNTLQKEGKIYHNLSVFNMTWEEAYKDSRHEYIPAFYLRTETINIYNELE